MPYGWDTKKFGTICIAKVTRPGKKRKDNDDTKQANLCSRFQVRPEWWEPVVWWLQNVQWTCLGLGNHGNVNKNTMLATWVELALVCQIQTGIRLAPDHLDLRSQENLFKSIVKRIWSRSKFRLGGVAEQSKYVWRPSSSVPACKPLIDHSRAVICRRPIVDNDI